MGVLSLATTSARIFQDNSGCAEELPVLLTERGPIDGLLSYQLAFLVKSYSWQRRVVQAVRLLLQYGDANPALCGRPQDLFSTFSVRLLTGTIGEDGRDPSGLYWKAMRSANARGIIHILTEFSSWLSKRYGTDEINPWREARSDERILAMAAWAHRNGQSFLGHLESVAGARNNAGFARSVPMVRVPRVIFGGEKGFPEDRFADLLFRGFLRHPSVADVILRLNVRDALITLLMHGGGIRCSECFHVWVSDVQEHPLDPSVAWVRIGHPSEGTAKWKDERGRFVEGTRAQYLAIHGMAPRHRLTSTRRAGWKNPALDEKWYIEVHWSDPDYGRVFLMLWKKYLVQIAGIPRAHPYAWVTMEGRKPGSIYCMTHYARAHDRAVRRIGLVPKRVLGTRVHNHRHAYARRLEQAGLPPKILKNCMHHSSLSSQLVYTEPERKEMNVALNAAVLRMNEAGAITGALLHEQCKREQQEPPSIGT